MLDGRLPLGTPAAERELAAHLGLSRATVSAGYADLRESGYLDSIRGSTASCGCHRASESTAARSRGERRPARLQQGHHSRPSPRSPQRAGTGRRAAASFLGESGFDALGLRVVRQALADLPTSRGLPTDADEIMITIGAQHAIGLLSRTLLSRGDRALVEVPSYTRTPSARCARRVPGCCRARSLGRGLGRVALEQAFQRTSPTLGYLMPDHRNPTGTSMSDELRTRTIEARARQGTTLIVDETMAEIGPRQPAGAVRRIGRAVTISSAKTIWATCSSVGSHRP
ncbi:MAG: aminotransferase class I/II-fold pyridoxal phosphate-dependent enzyme [Schumannella sp.]